MAPREGDTNFFTNFFYGKKQKTLILDKGGGKQKHRWCSLIFPDFSLIFYANFFDYRNNIFK